MKSKLIKTLTACTVLCGMLLVAPGVAAKKPVKPPPEPPADSCQSVESFAPDFAFARTSGRNNKMKLTIFAADSATGCERQLIELPYIDGDYTREFRFSSVEEAGNFYGRVVWRRLTDLGSGYWTLDFTNDGTEIAFLGDAEQILYMPRETAPNLNSHLSWMDLSPDARTLAFQYFTEDATEQREYLNLLKLGEFGQVCGEESCPLDPGSAFTLYEGEYIDDGRSFMFDPSWGPLGERLYLRTDPYTESAALQYYDLQWPEAGWPPEAAGPTALFRAEDYPNTTDVTWHVVGSFRDAPADPEFAGRFPGWNREGKLIHEYMGWTVQGNCHFSELGVWDGTSLNPILTGQWPDAASGLPYDG